MQGPSPICVITSMSAPLKLKEAASQPRLLLEFHPRPPARVAQSRSSLSQQYETSSETQRCEPRVFLI
jgi:hypothetical protein